uniref:Uncharacterized protein n=1 Tax=Acidicaldus sp. TaxID=1872105 RepID=A0A8J4M738_9PROT
MSNPKQLIVEGDDDLSVISNLAEKNIDNFKNDRNYLVEIKSGGSVKKILDKKFIRIELRQADLETIGFVLDADEKPRLRWESFRDLLREHYPKIPNDLPNEGLIITAEGKPRLGFWLMPDCQSAGMLENFLHCLVPGHEKDRLWQYAKATAEAAKKTHGAPYKDVHLAKAEIHTWLAWQREPGKRFGAALAARILDPDAKTEQPFLKWFKKLFDLPKAARSARPEAQRRRGGA